MNDPVAANKPQKMLLSIIIPAHNEASRILKTLEDYWCYFETKYKDDHELIVVPNDCMDQTCEVARNFARYRPSVQVHEIDHKVGKGGAVMFGFGKACGSLIGFSDADGSVTPDNFDLLITNIGSHDGIIGSRKIKGARIEPKRKVTQIASSGLFNYTTRALFGLKYKDTQCGAKLFKQNIAKELATDLSEPGWAFDVDVLYLCKRRGYKITEYPINWKDMPGSKLTFWAGIRSVINLVKYRIRST